MEKQQNQPLRDMPAKGGQQSQSAQQAKTVRPGQQGTHTPPPPSKGGQPAHSGNSGNR